MLPLSDPPLNWATVQFHLLAKKSIEFNNFPGFILRSGFGAALRRLCRYRDVQVNCRSCDFSAQCPYAYIFETPQKNMDIDFTAENFPHPFVMVPPYHEPYTVPAGQPFMVQFTLFGRGIPYLLFYIYAFDLLGDMGIGRRRRQFILERVVDSTTGNILFNHHDKTLCDEPKVNQIQEIDNAKAVDRLGIQFITPAKILQKNRSLESLTTDGLCRSLLRRASLLTKLHENSEWQIDYGDVIQRFNTNIELKNNQTHATRLERYSATQNRKHPLYALIGSAELCGNLQPFIPLLKTGEVIHIGSSTGQGLGKYRLS